ncbi:unnamed protein product [Caenorhabditis sp. 36 PRJEB53466]|nr:unnamed protein product [Caenorhabditis sp. 36 PRJEB53466]
MDETNYNLEDDGLDAAANKKYTFFVIDGGEAMFETSKAGEVPEFKLALKLILNEMVRVCCSRSLNNHIGVIIAGTKNSETEGLENSTVLVPMGILGQDEVNTIKDICEEDVLLSSVFSLTGGHHQSDISNVLNYCKRVFSSCPNTRHQSVIYLTNNRNPFGRDDFWDSSYFKRTKTAVTKIIGLGHRKTLGEFSVIMLPEDGYKPASKEDRNTEPWFHLDPEVFTTECDAAARIRQKITAQRSHANLTVQLGPGVTFDVSVFSLVMEARPLDRSHKYTQDTEQRILKTSGYVTKKTKKEVEEDEFTEPSEALPETDQIEKALRKCKIDIMNCKTVESYARRDLKKSITIGGEQIILDREQYDAMTEIDSKGVDVIGFVPLDRVDQEVSVISPKIIQPNDQTTLGSSSIYRALLDRCWARQQAIVCKYQSRSKQKMRIVALIPFKKDLTLIEEQPKIGEDGEEEEDKKPDVLRLEQQKAQADSSEWLHEGFMLVGLPFREELRDDFRRFEEQQTSVPEVRTEHVEVMKQFVKRLTMSYNPSFYENPRLLSERAALCLEATGEELIERRDTLEPYYLIPKRLQRVGAQIEQIVEKFALTEEDKKLEAKGRKRKPAGPADGQPAAKSMGVRECFAADKMLEFKKDELIEMALEHCEPPKGLKSKTKADIIKLIKNFLDLNPNTSWNVVPK